MDLFSFIVLTGLTVIGLIREVVKGMLAASVIVLSHTPAKKGEESLNKSIFIKVDLRPK